MQKLIMACKIFSALNELKWWQSPTRCIDKMKHTETFKKKQKQKRIKMICHKIMCIQSRPSSQCPVASIVFDLV